MKFVLSLIFIIIAVLNACSGEGGGGMGFSLIFLILAVINAYSGEGGAK